jgi:hypothetical protein
MDPDWIDGLTREQLVALNALLLAAIAFREAGGAAVDAEFCVDDDSLSLVASCDLRRGWSG